MECAGMRTIISEVDVSESYMIPQNDRPFAGSVTQGRTLRALW